MDRDGYIKRRAIAGVGRPRQSACVAAESSIGRSSSAIVGLDGAAGAAGTTWPAAMRVIADRRDVARLGGT